MIRFSAGLVVVAIGVLIGGVATSKLSLVYIAIGISAVALVALAIGVALKREELFGGGPESAAASAGADSGMPAGQSVGTGDVRGSAGHVREDRKPVQSKVPGPATAAFEAAAAAQAQVAAPTGAAPSMTTPTVGSPTTGAAADNTASGNPPLAHRRTGFGQASAPAGEVAADWQTRSPQPSWSSGDQVRPTWTPKDPPKASPPKAPQPGATPVVPPRAWASPEQAPAPTPASRAASGPVAPSWFDRLNQRVDDPAKAEPTVADDTQSSTTSAKAADVSPADATSTPDGGRPPSSRSATGDDEDSSSTTPTAADASDVDADDDDWPTRYSWLEDDETDEAADVTDAAETAAAETVAAKTLSAETVAAKTLPAPVAAPEEAKAAESDETPAPSASGAKLVTIIPGVPRYHDPDCILIRFMDEEDVARKSISEAKAANCTPCAACQPEG